MSGSLRSKHVTIASVVTLGMAFFAFISYKGLRRDWRSIDNPEMSAAMARITDLSTSRVWFSRHPETMLNGSFEFEVDGRTYVGTEFGRGVARLPSWQAAQLVKGLKRSGMVQVQYEVRDPSECYADIGPPVQSNTRGLVVLVAGFTTALVLWGTLPLWTIAKRRRQRRLGLLPLNERTPFSP